MFKLLAVGLSLLIATPAFADLKAVVDVGDVMAVELCQAMVRGYTPGEYLELRLADLDANKGSINDESNLVLSFRLGAEQTLNLCPSYSGFINRKIREMNEQELNAD